MLTRISLMLMVGLNMILVAQLHLLSKYIVTNQVWDIDVIRNQYTSDAYGLYIRGCILGTEYPEEYRKADRGFNTNSPMNWCYDKRPDIDEEVSRNAYGLGRTNQRGYR